jgi:hypothetical protein
VLSGPADSHTHFHVKVLSPMEVFHHSQAMRLLVSPDTLEAWAILERAQRVLPVPPSRVGETLEHVATRETEESLIRDTMSATRIPELQRQA